MTTYPIPTQHERLRLEAELRVAQKGQHVLELKRDALIFDLLDLLSRYETQYADVSESFANAVATRTRALEREGGIALRTAAWTRTTTPEVCFAELRIHGVEVPMILSRAIETPLDYRGYGVLGTSAAIDEVAETHERLLERVVPLAEMEGALKQLVDEIWLTNLRVNTIRHRLVPELDAQIRYVEAHLAERDHEERLRQFFFKRHAE
ncbi:V-type ATP synthase subunit D [Halogranum rubrum]|uniref:Uncharacterized protein n=1 Tax=Halogranum salarium B-1 TaxID=1210908 RepID=J3EZD5_9EURY|nr:V-type ATP synthase subunit D [Halogranum salarium]EJN60942.1 hypothetical protein HSB1_15450 [Halogranum salarium B-1]